MAKAQRPEWRNVDTEKDALRRRETPGTLDYTCALWERSENKHGLPDPLKAWCWAADSIREREPLVEILTPAVARKLAKMKSLRNDLLVVSANISTRQFELLRREALEAAGMKRLPRKPPATARHGDAELSLVLLYEHVLDGKRPSDLVSRVRRGSILVLRRDRKLYKRVVAKIQARIDSALLFLQQHGYQVSRIHES